jgi:hypothetical protein
MALWPALCAGLVTTLAARPAFADAAVYDGEPLSHDTDAFLAVGWVEDDNAGSYTQEVNGSGHFLTETGEIQCTVEASSGNSTLTTPRAAAFALADDAVSAIGADRTIGGLLPAGSSCDTSVQVLPVQDADGSTQRLVLTFSYTAPVSASIT